MPYIEIINLLIKCWNDSRSYWDNCKNTAWKTAVFFVLLRVMYMAARALYVRIKTGEWSRIYKGKLVTYFIDGLYITYLVYVTLGMRYMGMRREVDLILFDDFRISSKEYHFLIENVLLFIPFGFLAPATYRFFGKLRNMLPAAFLISVLIEILQYIFRCGKSEIDDVVLNVAGALVGGILYKILYKTGSVVKQFLFPPRGKS